MFLDLNLNGEDGFELLHWSLAGPHQTIVALANTDRAMEAFELGVADFISKPFSLKRVQKALKRAGSTEPETDSMKNTLRHLCVRIGAKIRLIPVGDIAVISHIAGYSELTLRNGDQLDHEWSLLRLDERLPDTFFRVHRKHIIALEQIKEIHSYRGSKYGLITRDDKHFPIGRSRLSALRERLGINPE